MNEAWCHVFVAEPQDSSADVGPSRFNRIENLQCTRVVNASGALLPALAAYAGTEIHDICTLEGAVNSVTSDSSREKKWGFQGGLDILLVSRYV
jgi:hypothetical protein